MDRIRVEVDGGPRALAVVLEALDVAGATAEGDPAIEERGGEGVRELVWVVVAIGVERSIEASIAVARGLWPELSVELRREDDDD